MTRIVTANRLRDGLVVFLSADGAWSERIGDAAAAADEAGRHGPLAMAVVRIAEYSCTEGLEAAGWQVMTMWRGRVAVENGELEASLGDGQFLRRKRDPEVTDRPAC